MDSATTFNWVLKGEWSGHTPQILATVILWVATMDQLVREGKISYVGNSNFAAWDVALAQSAALGPTLSGPDLRSTHQRLATKVVTASWISSTISAPMLRRRIALPIGEQRRRGRPRSVQSAARADTRAQPVSAGGRKRGSYCRAVKAPRWSFVRVAPGR